jgi:DNA-binding CsgD family transcriptional regulator
VSTRSGWGGPELVDAPGELAIVLRDAETVVRKLRAVTDPGATSHEHLPFHDLSRHLESLISESSELRLLMGCHSRYRMSLDMLMRSPALRQAGQDGRRVRLVLAAPVPPALSQTLTKYGAELRIHHADTSIFVALADGRHGVTPIDEKLLLLVRPSLLLDNLEWLWDLIWETAAPVIPGQGSGLPLDSSGPLDLPLRLRRDNRDEDVLRYLGLGVKDVVAAREMNISLRTYRRYVADLMDHIGASSRFQAGAIAARHGLLPQGRSRPTRPREQ